MYQLAKRQVQRGLRRINAEVSRPFVPAQDEDASSLYQPLPEGYIRLLSIHTEVDGTPNWRLESYSLNLAPRYDAISYSWGVDTTPRWIKVNRSMLKIRKTLSALLKASVNRNPPLRPLWIDAICLNQNDNAEKAVQVPLMAEVYKKASRTIVWLGEPDEGTFDTLIFMKTVMKYAESNDDIEDIGQNGLHPQQWADLSRYLQRSWFQRLWVLQEVLLSNNIEILCNARRADLSRGINVIAWKEVVRFEHMLQKRGAYSNLMGEDDEDFETFGIARSIYFMENLRGLLQRKGGHLNLSTLRQYHYSRHCHEPVDRVWGLLGLLSPKLRAQVHEAGIIDYSDAGRREYWRSYLAFMNVLHAFDATDFFHVITDDIGRKSNANLPSWCIDFNAPKLYHAFSAFRTFRAGLTGPNDHTSIQSSIQPTNNALSVTGFLVDQVSDITSVFSSSIIRSNKPGKTDGTASEETLQEFRTLVNWLLDCGALCNKSLSGSDRATKLALCLTMVAADRDSKGLDFAKSAAKREKVTEASILIEAHTSLTESLEAMLRGDAEPPEILHDDYLTALAAACYNRRVFATRHGRIGLGPPDVKTGDQICAIIGAEALFALRSADYNSWHVEVERRSTLVAPPAAAEKTFRLVGDAYVHGLMFGEAFAAEGRGPTRKLVLV